MKSLLTALQEGRLIELPDNNKNKALEYLADPYRGDSRHWIWRWDHRKRARARTTLTIPASVKAGRVLTHGRLVMASLFAQLAGVQRESTMVHPTASPCICWSCISCRTRKRMLISKRFLPWPKQSMHSQRLQDLKSLADLSEVRHRLLDAIHIALESTAPDARARMIQLEVKHAAVHSRIRSAW